MFCSGIVLWETKLEGRVECSASIVDDFSQVVHVNDLDLHVTLFLLKKLQVDMGDFVDCSWMLPGKYLLPSLFKGQYLLDFSN